MVCSQWLANACGHGLVAGVAHELCMCTIYYLRCWQVVEPKESERDVASRSVYVLALGWCVWRSSSSPEIQGVVRAAGGVCAPGNLVPSLSLVCSLSPVIAVVQ